MLYYNIIYNYLLVYILVKLDYIFIYLFFHVYRSKSDDNNIENYRNKYYAFLSIFNS